MSNDKSQMGPKTERRWYEAKMGDQQGLIISEATGETIAVTYKKENAAFIVKACNHFEETTSALRAIEARINGEWDNPSLIAIGELHTSAEMDILRIVEETLSKIEGA